MYLETSKLARLFLLNCKGPIHYFLKAHLCFSSCIEGVADVPDTEAVQLRVGTIISIKEP